MDKKDKESCLSLLNDFILHIDCLDELRSYTNEANIFNILRLNHFEIRHSNMLAWLLNPNENHGLGDRLLKKVLLYATNGTDLPIMKGLRPVDVELMNLSDTYVFREKENIDILIVSESNKLVLAIENKIFSKEHDNQLQKYLGILKSEYDGYRLILLYLTPEGIESSDPDNWVDMNYLFIKDQLEQMVKTCDLKEKAKLYIEDYILTIRRHIVEDKEIKEICNKIYFKHKDALDLIFENKPDLRSDISQFINRFLAEHESELGITYLPDSSTYTKIHFIPNGLLNTKGMGSGWITDDYLVAFEICVSDAGEATLHLIIGPGKEEYEHYRQKVLDAAVENKSLFKVKGNKIRNKWKTIDTFRLSKPSDDDEEDSSSLLEKIGKDLSAYLKNKAPEKVRVIQQVFKG